MQVRLTNRLLTLVLPRILTPNCCVTNAAICCDYLTESQFRNRQLCSLHNQTIESKTLGTIKNKTLHRSYFSFSSLQIYRKLLSFEVVWDTKCNFEFIKLGIRNEKKRLYTPRTSSNVSHCYHCSGCKSLQCRTWTRLQTQERKPL